MSLGIAIVADRTASYQAEINNIADKLRELIDYTTIFGSINECEEFVRRVRHEHIILIVTPDMISGVLTQNIHQSRRVESIFLFDLQQTMSSERILEVRRLSYKMQDVVTSSENLYQNLWQWVQEFTSESDVLLSVFAGCPSDATTTNIVNNIADFAEFWYPLYIDFVLSTPIIDPYAERCRFIEQCRIYFARNPGALKVIDDLETNYTPSRALYYYTCDGFIYRLMNRALRHQAIDKIMTFRFLLHDIRDQLRSEHEMFITGSEEEVFSRTFFRGQLMSHDELDELQKKHRAGTLITTNSYFSTSMDRALARVYAGNSTVDIVSVLFEVAVRIKSSNIVQRKPFAYIGNQSQYHDAESEVLFSIVSFFKIDRIFYNGSEALWIVQVSFIDDDDTTLEITKDFRTLQMCSSEVMIVKIGNLLANHPQQGISKAASFYEMIMKLNLSRILTSACYTGLGWLALKEKNADLAIEQQQIALNHYDQLAECESASSARLRIMCYNCMGNAFRLKKNYDEALSFFLKAQELNLKVPIDKYAMYDGYRNITAVNIACIYKLTNKIDRAWDTYKKMLAYDMNLCTRFHGHTYLTIAQAGLREAQLAHDIDEYARCSLSWKTFLDISLTSMSSNYRRSIISGVLLLGFEYANNEQTRAMAIDYFKKVINSSQRYVAVNRDDRLIVLQCQNQVSRVNTKMRNYDHAIDHALTALKMCSEDDLTDMAECFESMTHIYEQRLLDQKDDLTPVEISRMIVFDNPFASIFNNTNDTSSNVITFERSEFAFGQFLTNKINPALVHDTDHKRQLAYCLLKLAALAQMQGHQEEERAELNDDDWLRKQAREHAERCRQLIDKVSKLLQDSPVIQRICLNNMAYIDGNFDSIIEVYLQDLYLAQQKENVLCVGEDAFCYIAHLYGRKTNMNEELHWYQRAVDYFQTHGHICDHTIMCFSRLAHFYEKHNNFALAIDVDRSLVWYLLQHKPCALLRTSIAPIVIKLTEYFNERGDTERVIAILQQLIQLMLIEPADDMIKIDDQFKNIIQKCNDSIGLVMQAYLEYLEVILRHKPLSSNSYICAFQPAFHEAISAYQTHGNHFQVTKVCQQFLELLIGAKADRSTIEAALTTLALDLETLPSFTTALKVYTYLAEFILRYRNIEDLLRTGFVIIRCKFLKHQGAEFNTNTQQILIDLIIFCCDIADPHFVLFDYLKTMKANSAPYSLTGIYMSLLKYCMKHRSKHYNHHMKTSVAALVNRPEELIAFVTTNRVNYKTLILTLFERYGKGTKTAYISKKAVLHAEFCANEWLLANEDVSEIYWRELLHHLLEWQSKDGEYLASCYAKLNDMNSVRSVFDMELYGDPALTFSPNSCRRYLQYFYPQASSEQRIDLEQRYRSHFLIEYDSFSDQVLHDILPIEE